MIASTLTAEQLEWAVTLCALHGHLPLTDEARALNQATWRALLAGLTQADRARPAAAVGADGALDGS